jgi:hypothetical protein
VQSSKSIAILSIDPGLKQLSQTGLLFIASVVLLGECLEVEDVHFHFMELVFEGGKVEECGLVLFFK